MMTAAPAIWPGVGTSPSVIQAISKASAGTRLEKTDVRVLPIDFTP